MFRTRTSRSFVLAGAVVACFGSIGLAEEKPPVASLPGPRVARPPRPGDGGTRADSTSGWWMGSVAVAATLAAIGGLSLASKRFLPHRDSGPLQVIGRSSLSPKHSVYLVRVGDRVMIVGTGPQGPPSSLGEVTDPVELARLIPRRAGTARAVPEPSLPQAKAAGFDRRIGDDE